MAQEVTNPLIRDDEALSLAASKINNLAAAFISGNSGTSRSSSLEMGGRWFDTDTVDRRGFTYDGTVDLPDSSGRLSVNTTPVGNIGAGADVLQSFTLLPGFLSVNGRALRITAGGRFAANANAKTVSLAFGGTTVVTSGAEC